MKYITVNFISPNFGHEKLESPSYQDLVDVFEDRMRHWFLNPAERLLKMPHCEIAAVALLISYFEGIAIYLSGKDSRDKSFDFFANGFSKVFSVDHKDQNSFGIIARAIYDQARCGFAHDGMFRNRVFFSDVPSLPLLVTYRKKNGVPDLSQFQSIVINPLRFFESIRIHFEHYVKSLRDASDATLKEAFQNAVKLKWALDEEARAIGMTEEEFYRT
jgi:hypothetical protein